MRSFINPSWEFLGEAVALCARFLGCHGSSAPRGPALGHSIPLPWPSCPVLLAVLGGMQSLSPMPLWNLDWLDVGESVRRRHHQCRRGKPRRKYPWRQLQGSSRHGEDTAPAGAQTALLQGKMKHFTVTLKADLFSRLSLPLIMVIQVWLCPCFTDLEARSCC